VKRDGFMGGWTKLQNEELCDLYHSPSIIRVIKSEGVRWVGYITRGEGELVWAIARKTKEKEGDY
jgi:hypothetical protein